MDKSQKSGPEASVRGKREDLQHGRDAYESRAWAEAYRSLSSADQTVPLDAQDLELLATAAYLIGRDEEYLKHLERAHHAYLDVGNAQRAVRCAFWLGLRLIFRGETGPGTGWLARAQRMIDREERDCVEHGYLLLPAVLQRIEAGEWSAAHALTSNAATIGERFQEPDLLASAQLLEGRVLIFQGKVDAGLARLDEAMVSVTAGELSPLVTGLIYCSVIDACHRVYALSRAREWTTALTQWCEAQPDLVTFTGKCLVHRAEIMQLNGAWQDAIEEARSVGKRFSQWADQEAAAAARYQEAEVHRLRGDFAAAEQAYRGASQWGWEPQPGLALLRLAQGRVDAAAAAIRRIERASRNQLQRARFLPAYVEIMLVVNDIEAAQAAAGELKAIATSVRSHILDAIAAHAYGAIALAEGDAGAALGQLRAAFTAWQQVEAPYLAARIRVQIGLACRALGDEDSAKLEFDAARVVFEQLSAAPDLERVTSVAGDGHSRDQLFGLTRRELQVLRMVAAGKTNKAIATELFISEKTVDRHVSNIFDKLDVPSRTAATAYAYKHRLA